MGGPPAVGGLVSAVKPGLRVRGGTWIGWPGTAGEIPNEPLAKATRDAGYRADGRHNCESIPYDSGRAHCANEANAAHGSEGERFLVGRFIPCRRIAVGEKGPTSPKSLGTAHQCFRSSMSSPHTGSSSCSAESSSSVRLNFSYCAETSGQGRKCSLIRSPSRKRAADVHTLSRMLHK